MSVSLLHSTWYILLYCHWLLGCDEVYWIPEIRNTPGWFQSPKRPWLLVSGSQYLMVLNRIEIWAVPGPFQHRDLVFLRNSVATFDWQQGAPSCMKFMLPLICMYCFSFSLSNSTYLGPYIVVLSGMQYKPAVLWHDMAPQIVWLGRCFTVATTYFLPKQLPRSHVMCMCMVHSSVNNTFFHSVNPVAMTCGKSSLFFFITGVALMLTCGTSVHFFLLRYSKTVLEFIAVSF